MDRTNEPVIQLSPRGQLTLPVELRKALGLRAGDAFRVRLDAGQIVLEAVELTPVELYNEARIQEFTDNAQLSDDELAQAKTAWGL